MSDAHADPIKLRAVTVQQVLLAEARTAMTRSMLVVEAEWKQRAVRSRRTGTYLRSITSSVTREGNVVLGQIGTNLFYAPYLEYGTGLYGPRNRWIVPKRPGGVLAFPGKVGAGTAFRLTGSRRSGAAGAGGKLVFARRVRGIRPRRFARDAALVSLPRVEREMERGADRAAAALGQMVERGRGL